MAASSYDRGGHTILAKHAVVATNSPINDGGSPFIRRLTARYAGAGICRIGALPDAFFYWEALSILIICTPSTPAKSTTISSSVAPTTRC